MYKITRGEEVYFVEADRMSAALDLWIKHYFAGCKNLPDGAYVEPDSIELLSGRKVIR